MKKYAIAALAAIMALSATACSNNNASSADSTVSTSSTSSAAPDTSSASGTAQAATAEGAATAETPAQDESGTESGADLQAIYDKIIAAQDNSDDIIMFPESSDDIINGFYPGLTELNLTQKLLYMPPVTGNACEILLIEAADSENADKAEEIMKARVKMGADDTTYPDVAEVWQAHAMVQRSGNLLCMIALPMSCNVPDDVFAL